MVERGTEGESRNFIEKPLVVYPRNVDRTCEIIYGGGGRVGSLDPF